MDVAIVQEAFANCFAGAALEQHIVGQNDGGAAVDPEQAADVLEEVELFVAGGGPEVIAQNLLAFLHLVAILVDDRDAGLLAEWWVRKHHVVVGRWLGGKAVLAGGDVLLIAEAVQERFMAQKRAVEATSSTAWSAWVCRWRTWSRSSL
jgi:hypothetical protein